MVVHKNYFLKEKIFVFYKTHYLLKKKIYNKPKFYAETKLLLIKLFFQKKLVSFEKYIFMQKMCYKRNIYLFYNYFYNHFYNFYNLYNHSTKIILIKKIYSLNFVA